MPELIHSHLLCAHTMWRLIVRPGDTVVDATLGNGHDALFLATLLQGSGHLIGYDIQEKSIKTTQQFLNYSLSETEKKVTIELRNQCHSHIEANAPKLIVYNLGYLPGADKSLTTTIDTTLVSLKKAQKLVVQGGMISLTLYPGHPQGLEEQEVLLRYVASLHRQEWHVCWLNWTNRTKSPSLLLLQRNLAPQAS